MKHLKQKFYVGSIVEPLLAEHDRQRKGAVPTVGHRLIWVCLDCLPRACGKTHWISSMAVDDPDALVVAFDTENAKAYHRRGVKCAVPASKFATILAERAALNLARPDVVYLDEFSLFTEEQMDSIRTLAFSFGFDVIGLSSSKYS